MTHVLLFSSNYHPAHAQHMHAYARALQEMGIAVSLRVDDAYLERHPVLASFHENAASPVTTIIILNMGIKNIFLTALWRLQKKNVIFCVHEPITNLQDFREFGISKIQLFKLRIMRFLIWMQIKLCTRTVAFSEKTEAEIGGLKPMTTHPLLYVDHSPEVAVRTTPRNTIAYIGSIAKDHAFDEFVAFAKYCILHDHLPQCNFLIATKSPFHADEFSEFTETQRKRIKIHSGQIMTDQEIDSFYNDTAVLWCAYKRSNQSGVMPKAYMFGVPVIVGDAASESYFQHDELGTRLDCYEPAHIAHAVEHILADYSRFSQNCRKFYMQTFDYRTHKTTIKEMVTNYE